MKRLFFAAALALALHSLLFTVRFEGSKANPAPPSRPLTLSLAQAPTEPSPSVAVLKSPEPSAPRPHDPQAREEKPQPRKAGKPGRSPRSRELPAPPKQEQAHSATESQSPVSGQAPVTSTALDSPLPATPSLFEGGQGIKPAPVHEATPLYRRNPVPEYPLSARKRGFQGTVVLEVLVDRQGTVASLRLSNSSGYSVLDQAALASVKTWVFDPGTRGGERVEMWVKVPVRFQLE